MAKVSREITARVLVFRDGCLLVARGQGETFCHLVGGHVEPGEDPRHAVRREVREETTLHLQEPLFLETLANTWYRGSTRVEETLHLYYATLWPLEQQPRADEAWLEVLWVPVLQLDTYDVRPREAYLTILMAYQTWGRREQYERL